MQFFKQCKVNSTELTLLPFSQELVMEAYLIENPDIFKLGSDTSVDFLSHQISLKKGGKLGGSGRLDVLARYYEPDYICIMELKNGPVDKSAIEQLKKYLDERNEIKLEDFGDKIPSSPKWMGVLVGTEADTAFLKDIDNGNYDKNDIPIAVILLNRFKNNNGDVFVFSETHFKQNTRTTYNVKLLDLISAKKLKPKEVIYMDYVSRNRAEKQQYSATILEDGSLELDGENFPSLSRAALHVIQITEPNRKGANGWTYWKTADGKFLDAIREQYLQSLKK
jgi:hypothetical protein